MMGIYIHIPFCAKKCKYCNFISTENDSISQEYLIALKKEMQLSSKVYKHAVDSVFIGGGTPSSLEDGEIRDLMNTLRHFFVITNDAEITIESNPTSLTQCKLDEYKEAGINRLSIGLQAIQDRLLNGLGRQHNMIEFDRAFDRATNTGFDNINIDAIYAIPSQTLEEWTDTLYHLLYKQPAHISAYALSIEPDTQLGKLMRQGQIEAVSDDIDYEMYHTAQCLLAEKGYHNYEVSNFSIHSKSCRHNLKYWNLENYLGLGVSAHSYVDGLRFNNSDSVTKYMERMHKGSLTYEKSSFVSEDDRRFEYIMLKLRLNNGISFVDYQKQFQQNFEIHYAPAIEMAQRYGLAHVKERRLLPTSKGFALQNQLAGLFL